MEFVLLPKLTEKTFAAAANKNQYTFVVAAGKGSANKKAVAQYIAATYKVTVEAVKHQNRLGKIKRFGRRRSEFQMPSQQVFVVKLKAGDKIPGFNLNEEPSKK